jgi:predicted NBD/HSP70 family sugar kinase
MTTGTDQLRRRHTALVLRTLRGLGRASRAELAVSTGLAKATVGVIVAGLEQAGVVREEAVETVGAGGVDGPLDVRLPVRGRPGRPLVIAPGSRLGLGLELNVDYVSAVVLDLDGEVRATESRPVGADRLESLLGLAAGLLEQFGAGRFVGVTVAVPALVSGDGRTIGWAPNVPVEGSALADRVGALLPGRPVRLTNDANSAAYAEAHHGAARGASHALYLTGTVGIGLGIVSEGHVVTGGSGFAGEAGHVPVGDPDAPCGCGRRGCWEASIGLHAMLRALHLDELGTPTETAAAVAARAAVDAEARAVLARVGRDLGLGLATLTSVLDPTVVVLGGYFVPLGDLVLGPAAATLEERLDPPGRARPELRLSELGLQAAALGAAERSLSDLLLA